MLMDFLNAETADLVAEKIHARLDDGGHRPDVQRKILHLLLRQPARLDARGMMRNRHRRGVFVKRAVDEIVSHGWKPPPVREISECAK